MNMRKYLASITLIGALFGTPAFADWTGKDATPATITFKNAGNCTAVVCVPQTALTDSTGVNFASFPTAGADAVSNTSTGILTYGRNLVFNGATWDRWTGAVTNAGTFAVQLSGATNNINNISGTISLPTGAGTSANQASQLTQETATAAALGTTTDAVGTTPSTGSAATLISLAKAINNNVSAAIPAGSAIIGKVGIDQTTPGTTNGVQVNAALPAGTNLLGKTGIDQTTPGTTNGTQDASTGSTGATAPIKAIEAGGIAQNAEATAVTNGQLKGLVTDLVGKLITLPYSNPENSLNGQITTAMVATTSTAVTGMGAQGAGVRNYITACTFSNTHATVGTMINLQDGSGGTVLWQAPAGPAYAGAVTVFPNAIKTTANTGLFAVNATTGSSTLVSCTGYKGL
jgi:hypothetical protein